MSTAELADLRLIVSELVTNAVRHSGLGDESEIEMRIAVVPGSVKVEVFDEGPGFDEVAARAMVMRGHGLDVVGQLSRGWGTDSGPRTRVWAEMDLLNESAGPLRA